MCGELGQRGCSRASLMARHHSRSRSRSRSRPKGEPRSRSRPKPVPPLEARFEAPPPPAQEQLAAAVRALRRGVPADALRALRRPHGLPAILGRGAFGRVTAAPSFAEPAVVKEALVADSATSETALPDGRIVVTATGGLTTEALLLACAAAALPGCPHLPRVLDFGTNAAGEVVRLVTARCGLGAPLQLHAPPGAYFDEGPLWMGTAEAIAQTAAPPTTWLATLRDLLPFVRSTAGRDGRAKLPGGARAAVWELFDAINVAYLAVQGALARAGVYINDIHGGNVFLRWGNAASHALYAVRGRRYVVPTFGLTPVFGDLGTSLAAPHPRVVVVGRLPKPEAGAELLDRVMRPAHYAHHFMLNLEALTRSERARTVADAIMTAPPYADLHEGFAPGVPVAQLDTLQPAEVLLRHYDRAYGAPAAGNAGLPKRTVDGMRGTWVPHAKR